jgi:hypothetical protein
MFFFISQAHKKIKSWEKGKGVPFLVMPTNRDGNPHYKKTCTCYYP